MNWGRAAPPRRPGTRGTFTTVRTGGAGKRLCSGTLNSGRGGRVRADGTEIETFISGGSIAPRMKVAVVGLGYVGIPVAAALASSGVRVVGIDIDVAKAEAA